MPLDLQVKIPMNGHGMGSSGAAASKFERTKTALDDGDYDGATYYFEVDAWNTHATISYFIRLIDSSDAVKATITIPALTGNSTQQQRFRSTAFTPVSGSEEYRVEFEQTAATNQVGAYAAFIIIDQVNATKTRLPFHINHRAGGTASDGPGGGEIDAEGGASFVDILQSQAFTKDDAWFDGYTGIQWEFETLSACNAGTGEVQLEDAAGDPIATQTIDTTFVIRTTDITADADWTDGGTFHTKHRKISGATLRTFRTAVYVTLTGGLTKARIFHFMGIENTISTNRTHFWRLFNESGKFQLGVILRFGASGFDSVDGDVNVNLFDVDTDDGPGPGSGSTVSGSSLAFVTGTAQWEESGSLTMDEDDRFEVDADRPTGGTIGVGLFQMIYDADAGASIEAKTRSAADQMVMSDAVSAETAAQLELNVADDPWPAYAEEVLTSIATHLTRAVADDINAATWNDAVATDLAVHQDTGIGDAMTMADAVAVQLSVHLEINVSDDMNNWADSVATPSTSLFVGLASNVLVLFTMELAGGNDYTSNIPVRGADRYFEGRVVNFGGIDRSIPIPAGLPRIGDGFVELADTDQKYRKLFATNPPQGRIIELVMLPRDEPLSLAQRIYRGEITNVEFPEGSAIVQFADITFEFLDEDIPALGVPANFASLPDPEVEIFVPIPIGNISSVGLTDEGAYQAHLIDTTQNLYAVSRYPIEEVTNVYRKGTTDPFFSVVSPSEYAILTEARTIDPYDYVFTYVAFTSAQADGTEIRVDVKGWIPQDDVDLGLTVAQTDPARILKAMLKEISRRTDDQLNLPAFTATEALTLARGYLAGGVYNEAINQRSAYSQFVSSFNIDLFQNKSALIMIDLADVADPTRPVFDDVLRLIRDSVFNALPNPYYNRFRYNYQLDHPSGEWSSEDQFDNEIERGVTGSLVEAPLVDMHFVRESGTALQVISDISSYFSLGSYQFKTDLPGPQVVDVLELAKNIGVTHYGGIDAAGLGYVNTEFRTHSIVFDPNLLRYTVSAIRRVLPPAEAAGLLEVNWQNNAVTGPYMPINGTFFGVFIDQSNTKRLTIVRSQDWGLHWAEIDEDNSPTFTNTIESFDSYWDEGNDLILEIAVQEGTTGRTSYQRFDMGNGSWLTTDEVVDASPGVTSGGTEFVSIIKTRTSKKLVIFYSVADTAGAVDPNLKRQKASIKPVGGSWGTPFFVGDDTSEGSYHGNRVVAGMEDRIHFFYMFRGSIGEGYGTSRIEDRSLTLNNSEGNLGEFIHFSGNIVYYHSSLPYGQVGTKLQAGGGVTLEIPTGSFFMRPSTFLHDSADSLVGGIPVTGSPPNAGFSNHMNSVTQPQQMGIGLMYQGEGGTDGSTRYAAVSVMRNGANVRYGVWPSPNFSHPVSGVVNGPNVVLKSNTTNFAFSWSPATTFLPQPPAPPPPPPPVMDVDNRTNLQAGPTWNRGFGGAFVLQKMTTRLYTLNGIDYIAYFMHGGVNAGDSQIMQDAGVWDGGVSATFFRWVKIGDLPDDDSFDNTAFVQSIADVF